MIIILVLTCELYLKTRYLKKFDELKNLLQNNPNYDFIFIKGDPNQDKEYVYDEQTKILTAKINDFYDGLPLKVYSGIKYIIYTFDNVEGILKTDDDIVIKNKIIFDNLLPNKIYDYVSLYKIDKCNNKQKLVTKFYTRNISFEPTKELINKKFNIKPYCYGGGYYISFKSCKIILNNYDIIKTYISEDVAIGFVLNKNKIYPKHIKNCLGYFIQVNTSEELEIFNKKLNDIKKILT